MAGYFRQKTTTTTATVTDVSTVHTKSVSYITHTMHFGVEQPTTVYSSVPIVPTSLLDVEMRTVSPVDMSKKPTHNLDWNIFLLVAVALLAFILGLCFSALYKDDTNARVDDDREQADKPATPVLTAARSHDQSTSSSKSDTATGKVEIKDSANLKLIEELRIRLRATRSKLAAMQEKTPSTNSKHRRRLVRFAKAAINSGWKVQNRLDNSKVKVKRLTVCLTQAKIQRDYVRSLHEDMIKAAHNEKEIMIQRHKAALRELRRQLVQQVCKCNASEFQRHHRQKQLQVDIQIQEKEIYRQELSGQNLFNALEFKKYHAQAELFSAQSVGQALEYDIEKLKDKNKRQGKLIRRLKRTNAVNDQQSLNGNAQRERC